jgi:hypothetical protein
MAARKILEVHEIEASELYISSLFFARGESGRPKFFPLYKARAGGPRKDGKTFPASWQVVDDGQFELRLLRAMEMQPNDRGILSFDEENLDSPELEM